MFNMTNTDPTTSAREVSKSIRTTTATWNRFRGFAASNGLTAEAALSALLDIHALAADADRTMATAGPGGYESARRLLSGVRNITVAGGGHK